MTELTREQIKAIRDGGKSMALRATAQGWVQSLCDMALRTRDAEQQAGMLEEQIEELLEETYVEKQAAAQLRNRAVDAEQRAIRAETHLHKICEMQALNYGDGTKTHLALIDLCKEAREALTTPPEGERLCGECTTETDCALRNERACDFPDTPQQPEDEPDVPSDDEFLAAYGDEPPFTEQPEDALALDLDGALDCLYTKAMRGRDLIGPDAHAISQAYDLVRSHLTAPKPCPHVRTSDGGTSYCALAESGSAVPYVPDEVRRLPEEWRKVAAATRVTSLSDAAEEASADIYDQCADELERALASAPAVPSVLESERGAIESSIDFINERIKPRRCDSEAVSGCWRCKSVYLANVLERMLAAAPTKGGQP